LPALSTIRLPSVTLGRVVTYSALLPEPHLAGKGPYSVLYLLHPDGGDHADWIVKTRLEDHVRTLPLLVICPSLGNGFGCDMDSGEDDERFFLDDLMAHVESTFFVQHGPESTAVAGAAEGGYAALRLALSFPYWFGSAASLSGTVYAPDEARMAELSAGGASRDRLRRVFGPPDDSRRRAWNLTRLAERVSMDRPPALYLDCGRSDPLLAHNRDFRKRLNALRIRHDYHEAPGGHDWRYWDSRLPEVLTFLSRSLEVEAQAAA
jgi:putative tributyrin esterase